MMELMKCVLHVIIPAKHVMALDHLNALIATLPWIDQFQLINVLAIQIILTTDYLYVKLAIPNAINATINSFTRAPPVMQSIILELDPMIKHWWNHQRLDSVCVLMVTIRLFPCKRIVKNVIFLVRLAMVEHSITVIHVQQRAFEFIILINVFV